MILKITPKPLARPAAGSAARPSRKSASRPAAGRAASHSRRVAILPLFEEQLQDGLAGKQALSASARDLLAAAASAESFEARAGQVLTVHLPAGEDYHCLMALGLGKAAAASTNGLRAAIGDAARQVPKGVKKTGGAARLLLDPDLPGWREFAAGAPGNGAGAGLAGIVQAAGEGWVLGSYAYVEHKTENEPTPGLPLELELPGDRAAGAADLQAALKRAEIICESVVLARNLANAPGNQIHPVSLAAQARELARSSGLACKVLDEAEIRREKMGALLGVAQGSDLPPRFIILEYRPPARSAGSGAAASRRAAQRQKAPLIFIGKAITFDSGGISIKPAKGMEEMKADMSGGAAVLCALHAIARLKPAVPVIGIIPSAENMISGSAIKPGDVVRSRAGLTIEVINTDAEGRLILADALDYCRKYNPRMVVDLATLTGACVVALGDVVTGLMSTDDEATGLVRKAAAACGERVWQLPLYPEYYEALKSDTADLKNSGGRNAGAITAGAFLSRFIEGVPWVHLDIAGTAWSEKESGYRNKGGTGVGVRLLVELALEYERM